jgi:hypothetical protein
VSSLVPSPDTIDVAPEAGGGWTSAGAANTGQPYAISVRTTRLGYFVAAATDASPGQPAPGGPGVLPVVVAVAIGLVLLAAVPLLLARRRPPRRRPRKPNRR